MIKVKNAYLQVIVSSQNLTNCISITMKTIISRDVVFKEQESLNGTIDKTIHAQVPLMEVNDVVEKEKQQ